MAENNQPKFSNLRDVKTNALNIGMNKDLDPQLSKEGQYTHAVNAKLNSHNGNFTFIQNEPSTIECLDLGKDYLSSIALLDGKYVIFSGENNISEIGIFDSNDCTYEVSVTDPCLNFNKNYPPSGLYQQIRNCDDIIYFVDNYNPDRYLNLNNIPYITIPGPDDCDPPIVTTDLDCDKLRLRPVLTTPKIDIELSQSGGKLSNAAYQVAIAYSEKGVRITDIYSVTQPISIFSHQNFGGGIDITLSDLDKDFSEYILYLIQTTSNDVTSGVGGVSTVYEMGTYDTHQNVTHAGNINDISTIPYGDVFLQSIYYEKSKKIVSVDDRALLIGTKTRSRINYQPLANNIRAKWVAKTVSKDYYKNGGKNRGYMREETYPQAIQFQYSTGGWTEAFHIPGRQSKPTDLEKIYTIDAYELHDKGCEDDVKFKYKWEIYDTSEGYVDGLIPDDCDEIVVGTGELSYWESLEKYPTNAEVYTDLSCEPIRHHKMPDINTVPYETDGGNKIILGMEFSNIAPPVDCNGDRITDIVRYRIVRGDRTNHKSIQGKGLLYNMSEYEIPDTNGTTGYYPNYPYNDLRDDQFLSKDLIRTNKEDKDFKTASSFRDDLFTFHSPNFDGFNQRHSFGTDLFIEGEYSGACSTTYTQSYKHPKNALLTNAALAIAALIGVGGAYLELNDQKEAVLEYFPTGNLASTPPAALAFGTYNASVAAANLLIGKAREDALEVAKIVFVGAITAIGTTAMTFVSQLTPHEVPHVVIKDVIKKTSAANNIPSILGIAGTVNLFINYFGQYANIALEAIKNFSRLQTYDLQINSFVNYGVFGIHQTNNRRRRITNASYLYPVSQLFEDKSVNNLYRESSVVLRLNSSIAQPLIDDTSRQRLEGHPLPPPGTTPDSKCDDMKKNGVAYRTSTASSHYASIRRKLPSQYGQIDSIKYLDTGYCADIVLADVSLKTDSVFGGDTFLTTYTLKRKMQYFNQTANGNEDNYQFDYSLYPNVPYPRYWMDTFSYDMSSIVDDAFDGDGKFKLKNLLNLPSEQHNLSCDGGGLLVIKDEHMYLSNNGVVSYTSESEFNLDLRDWDDREGHRHYDEKKHTDLNYIFRQDFRTIDNQPLYNSAYSKQLTENYIPTQDRDFTCTDESRCYTVYENRVLYSLQYQEGGQVDNWRSFLANNYYDFPKEAGNLLATKPLDRNNIAFLFDNSAPWITTAQDTLQTDSGNKVTVGDGGLFAQRPRPILTTDTKYGAASHSKAITHTQYGLFYPSADQGRIYVLNGTNLDEINVNGLNWWLKENMPFNITSIPGAPTDSRTIGYVSVFDNKDEIYYLTKKDYTPLIDDITYDSETDTFQYNGEAIEVTDSSYFEDCSWTISYFPKMKAFISFHDWHPDSTIQTQDTPLTVSENIIYKHNETCENYCYYYKKQNSFDIEYVVNNGQQTSTLSSIEYSLEAYKYFNNCKDSHHLLDYNFNRAFIHNTEQTSGMLHLNLASKNDITKVCYYPRVGVGYIDVEFSKVEQKYRFNQFWDVTKNKAEFNNNYVPLISTECNAYKYLPNPEYIDYNKPLYQRKKIRHNWNKIYLSRVDSPLEMNKIIFKFTNSKEIVSTR